MLACIYVLGICMVGGMLFLAVDRIEPNRRYALVLKILIIFVSAAAIAGKADSLTGGGRDR
jgi:type IV secretory pathway VirB2 component (pilin)